MRTYVCPKCRERTMNWDARAQCFLCGNPACYSAVVPPVIGNLSDIETGRMISRHDICVLPSWIERCGT